MGNVYKATRASTVSSGDLLAGWSQEFGDDCAFPLSVLMTYINANLSGSRLTVQYAAPAATDFSVTVGSGNTHLIITPAGAYADGAIVLPSGVDREVVTVTSTQAVTAFAVSGGTVYGAPTTLAANGFFSIKYDGVMGVWYRIG